jgi:RNA polymerase sigma factor (sigma-70 family)
MAPLDTSTWLRTRQDAAFPYETARQQMAQTLHERNEWIGERDRHLPNARELAARRAAVAEAIPLYLGALTRYVQREVTRWEEQSLAPPGEIAIDEIVSATYEAALEHAGEAPQKGIYDWLRRLARQEALVARLDEETRQRYEVSLESPLTIGDDEERGHVLRLIDVLADPHALLPEEILAHEAVRRSLDRALAKLPERWREAFLLRALDGWPLGDIADAEGFALPEVQPMLDASRLFLREWLVDADRWRVR